MARIVSHVHRLASRSALWLLLGFVLGGIAAPIWHAIDHAMPVAVSLEDASAHVHPGDPGLAETPTAEHPFACALCGVTLTWTPSPAPVALATVQQSDALGVAAVRAPRGPTAMHPAPRGPPAC